MLAAQSRLCQPRIIVDNLSAHKTQQVRTFLIAHPSVHLHYTATYSSRLNQVELWFSKIERDVTARGHLHLRHPRDRSHRCNESAARQAMPRSESMPSK
jgi:transposase